MIHCIIQRGLYLARKKDKNEIEHLRGTIRELEAENRRLRKQVRNAEKHHQDPIDYLDELLEEELSNKKKEKVIKCPQCYVGNIEVSDLGIKTLEKCTECTYRKTRNK